MRSKPGLVLSGAYVLVAAYFIATQGLFGESFIALILGLPWSMLPSFFEFGGTSSSSIMMTLIFAPMIINTALLYWIGSLFGASKEH